MNYIIKVVENEDELGDFLGLAQEVFPEVEVEVTEDDTLFLAYSNGEPIGFTHFRETDEFYLLKGFGVSGRCRGNGIGRNLLGQSMEFMVGKPVFLKTDSLNPAVNLYAECGFFMEEFGGKHVLVRKELN